MKKQILELLRELEKYTGELCVEYYSNCRGWLKYAHLYDSYLFSFDSETELIQGLKNKIKELKK